MPVSPPHSSADMTARCVVAAVDIGASGGRVMAGVIDGGRVTLDPIYRFPNLAEPLDGYLRWNITGLFEEVLHGLGLLAVKYPEVASIGIDTWAVDYGLLDANGHLLAEPISYRDPRTDTAVQRVHERLSQAELFEINGLQFLPFNTMYQLVAEQNGALWQHASHIVLLPDLIAYWLTGTLRTEYTNATTTGLVDIGTRQWSSELLAQLGIPASMLPEIEHPGATRGPLISHLAERLGMDSSTVVTTVGSHDTASAIVGVPAIHDRFAYIASGTWSLVGVELDHVVVTASALTANFTNEGGVDGTTRLLRNVGGLWLLQESMRTWVDEGYSPDLQTLLDDAAALPSGSTFDVDNDTFLAPSDMPMRIANSVSASGQRAPSNPAEVVRCILDSLAASYAHTIRHAAELSGREIDVVHIVGGGSQNELLCQLTANATGKPVIAGPVEATAIGNVLVQARAIGAAPGSLQDLRALVIASTKLTRYQPW
jgi:rhamnulokinase